MKVTLFSEELRKCLNAAGLSDCGENDAWSYWYHRVMEAHIEAVDRATATEQAENAELRQLIAYVMIAATRAQREWLDARLGELTGRSLAEALRELGMEGVA